MNDSTIYAALRDVDPAFLDASFKYRRDVRRKFLGDIAAAILCACLFTVVFKAEYADVLPPPLPVWEVMEKAEPAMLPESVDMEFQTPKKEDEK